MSIPVEFASGKPLIGMVHLLPLPGSPRWSGRMDQVIERALRDARLGPIGGDDHSADEWLDLDSVVPRTALLAALIHRAGEAL